VVGSAATTVGRAASSWCRTRMHDAHREFLILAREAQRICDTDATWATKYELVFSGDISRRMEGLIEFTWCDPDTSYEEDVLAFCRAATEKADDIEKALGFLVQAGSDPE
jgi:hypothetical protein